MPSFSCPHCGNVLEDDGSLVGQQVVCPHCRRQFIMPGAVAPPIGVPRITPPPVSVLAARRTQQGSASDVLFHFFDWRFEHYLTPWIIRIMWVLFLVGAALSIVSFGLDAIGVEVGDVFGGRGPVDFRPGGPIGHREPNGAFVFASRVVWFVVKCIALAMLLLYVRVVLETLIVLFNIATTLT